MAVDGTDRLGVDTAEATRLGRVGRARLDCRRSRNPLVDGLHAYSATRHAIHGRAATFERRTSILARHSFLQGRLPIQHYREGHGSPLSHRHADQKASAVRRDVDANKTGR